jgi:hypothetical protein
MQVLSLLPLMQNVLYRKKGQCHEVEDPPPPPDPHKHIIFQFLRIPLWVSTFFHKIQKRISIFIYIFIHIHIHLQYLWTVISKSWTSQRLRGSKHLSLNQDRRKDRFMKKNLWTAALKAAYRYRLLERPFVGQYSDIQGSSVVDVYIWA